VRMPGFILRTLPVMAQMVAAPLVAAVVFMLSVGSALATNITIVNSCVGQYPATPSNRSYTTYTYATGLGTVDNAPQVSDSGRSASATTLDLFTPAHPPKPPPVIVSLHGGYFSFYPDRTYQALEVGSSTTGQDLYLSQPSPLTGNGYAVAEVWYPLAASEGANAFPTELQAAVCAIRFLKANSKQLGIDGSRMMIYGISAGAAIGSTVAAIGSSKVGPIPDPTVGTLPRGQHYDNPNCAYNNTTNTQVLGSLNYYGFYDLVGACSTMGQSLNYYFGADISCPPAGSNAALFKSASSYWQATSSTPPMFISRGSQDTASPQFVSDAMYKKTQQLGIPSAYITVPNALHGFFMLPPGTDADYQQELCTALTFMKSVLKP
jgi:acetyl esterase/lipase